jgi:hypothetical protein
MVAKNAPDGLIVTTATEASSPLGDLAADCGWPMLMGANARMLLQEFSLRIPSCVLFWLDDWQGVAPTARLIAWLRERNAKPYRVAVACNLDRDAETALRAAGAHSFLPLRGESGAAVVESLRPLFAAVAHRHHTAIAPSLSSVDTDYVPRAQFPSDLARPP